MNVSTYVYTGMQCAKQPSGTRLQAIVSPWTWVLGAKHRSAGGAMHAVLSVLHAQTSGRLSGA